MYPLALNNKRITIVGEAIGNIGLDSIRRIEESDPQFVALKRVYERTGSPKVTCLAAICNAIVSYRLTGLGEDYWLEFAEYFSKLNIPVNTSPDYIVDSVIEFLFVSKNNRLLINQKINRLRKLKKTGAHTIIFDKCPDIVYDLRKLLVIIANSVGARPDAKTIVFAAKMAYYVARIHGINTTPPMDIMIPVDRRIGLLSYTSGIVDVKTKIANRRVLEEILLRYSDVPREAWRRVSIISSVPPLNIDSLVWFVSRGLGRIDISAIRRNAINTLLTILGEKHRWKIVKLVKEIYFRDIR